MVNILNYGLGNQVSVSEEIKKIVQNEKMQLSFSAYNEAYLKTNHNFENGKFTVRLASLTNNNNWFIIGNYESEEECLQVIKKWQRVLKKETGKSFLKKGVDRIQNYPIWCN